VTLWNLIPIRTATERRALALWQSREMTFPAFVRRMRPDTMDLITGAWSMVLDEAEQEIKNERQSHTD